MTIILFLLEGKSDALLPSFASGRGSFLLRFSMTEGSLTVAASTSTCCPFEVFNRYSFFPCCSFRPLCTILYYFFSSYNSTSMFCLLFFTSSRTSFTRYCTSILSFQSSSMLIYSSSILSRLLRFCRIDASLWM